MFDFFRLRAGMVGVRGIKLPYTGLDLQGDTPQDVVLDPDMLHVLATLYGIDAGGNPRLFQTTPQGALAVAISSPEPETVTYAYTQVMGQLTIDLRTLGGIARSIMFRALGNGINVRLSYDGENYPVSGILMYDRRVVLIRGAVVSFKLNSNAPFYGPSIEYWVTRPATFTPH